MPSLLTSLRNEFVWEPAIRALLTTPADSLEHFTISISFWVDSAPEMRDTDDGVVPYRKCTRALNWKLLQYVSTDMPV